MASKKKILVVDDEANLTRMLKRNLEATGKLFHPLTYAPQSQMCIGTGYLGVKALAIVGNAQAYVLMVACQSDVHTSCLSVLGHIGQRLLSNPEQGRLHRGREPLVDSRQGEVHLQALLHLITRYVLSQC